VSIEYIFTASLTAVSGSYCTGEAGKSAFAGSSAQALLAVEEEEEAPPPVKSLADMHREKLEKLAASEAKEEAKPAPVKSRLARHGDDDNDEDPDFDRARLRDAVEAEKKRKKMTDEDAWLQTKKQKTTDVTQEEMEAYRLGRNTFEDPMANYDDTE
jgi:pre-mRNA-processing factor SLU7